MSVVIDAEEGEARKKQSPGITLVLNGGDRDPLKSGASWGSILQTHRFGTETCVS